HHGRSRPDDGVDDAQQRLRRCVRGGSDRPRVLPSLLGGRLRLRHQRAGVFTDALTGDQVHSLRRPAPIERARSTESSAGGSAMVRRILATATLLLIAWNLAPSTPRAQDARAGAAFFADRCASCHGADARGQNGPNLTTLWTSGATDERVFQTIRRGVPGSVMP